MRREMETIRRMRKKEDAGYAEKIGKLGNTCGKNWGDRKKSWQKAVDWIFGKEAEKE